MYPSGGLDARTGVSTGRAPLSWPYLQLLEAARSLGRADGGLAAQVEPADSVGPHSTCCRGREPEEFARLLWADRPGAPPSGLRVNAPLWYAHGFSEGLAVERRHAVTADGTGSLPRTS